VTPEPRADAWVERCTCGSVESHAPNPATCGRGDLVPIYFDSSVRELVEALEDIDRHFPGAGLLAREALARFHQSEQPCPECDYGYLDTGTTNPNRPTQKECPRCHGTGTIPPEQPG
jgi:hypothetical protein